MKLHIGTVRGAIKPFCVTDGRNFRLSSIKPDYASKLDDREKRRGKELLDQAVKMIEALQNKLYATNKFGVLLILPGMDTSGKDGVIKHVMSGVNPQGCDVFSFKAPSATELDHDYLWRCSQKLPNRGQIGIFNRSYYEETLVVRVHPELLEMEKLPGISRDIWQERFEDFRSYERYLARNGIVVVKFFLHISKGEQKKRLLERLDRPEKNWKFSDRDVVERGFWKKYQRAYADMIRNTATKHAPWYVIPANKKWFARLIISFAIIDALEKMNLAYPKVTGPRK